MQTLLQTEIEEVLAAVERGEGPALVTAAWRRHVHSSAAKRPPCSEGPQRPVAWRVAAHARSLPLRVTAKRG